MKELLSNEEIDTLLDLFRTEGLIEAQGADLGFESRSDEGPVVSDAVMRQLKQEYELEVTSHARSQDYMNWHILGNYKKIEKIADGTALERGGFAKVEKPLLELARGHGLAGYMNDAAAPAGMPCLSMRCCWLLGRDAATVRTLERLRNS